MDINLEEDVPSLTAPALNSDQPTRRESRYAGETKKREGDPSADARREEGSRRRRENGVYKGSTSGRGEGKYIVRSCTTTTKRGRRRIRTETSGRRPTKIMHKRCREESQPGGVNLSRSPAVNQKYD